MTKPTNKCSLCLQEMDIYYQNLDYIIYLCNECYHFKGNIFTNNKNNSVIKDLKLDILNINTQTFYSTFHNTNSYIILDINDLNKIISQLTLDQHIYFLCESYHNIEKASKGSYDFYSTSSIKYLCSKYNLQLTNMFIIKDTNKTIYEFTSMFYDKLNRDFYTVTHCKNKVTGILYDEISYGLYLL